MNPKRRKLRQLKARPIPALAICAALLPGHFAPFRSLTPGPARFSAMNSTPAPIDSQFARRSRRDINGLTP
jgi:hypothetical protein